MSQHFVGGPQAAQVGKFEKSVARRAQGPAIFALMLDRAPPRLQGMAVGGFHFAYQLGLLSSPPLFGVIAERWGYAPMWWIAGAMALGAIGPYLLPERRAGSGGREAADARISDAEQ